MKGLLIKDFKMTKKHGFILLLLSAIFFLGGVLSSSSMFLLYSVFMLYSIPTSVLAFDEASKWNRYETVIPVSKAKIVMEKYIFVLTLIIPATLIDSMVYCIKTNSGFQEMLNFIFIMIGFGIILPTVIFPITFRFGFLKARLIGVLMVCILTISITFINSADENGGLIDGLFTPPEHAYLITVFAGLLFFASFGLSVALYKKREF